MGYRPTKEEVYAFLQDPTHMHGVLAYLTLARSPDTAFVAFSATPELEIIFGTSDASRKFSSLQRDPRVGFNVTDRERRYTVQLRGLAVELTDSQLRPHEDAHYAKLGEASRRFKDLPDQHFFIIQPFMLRFSDCLEEPWTLTTLI